MVVFEKLVCGPIRMPARYDERHGYGTNLPDDGFPRITTAGVHILEEGLGGDFKNWTLFSGNHPYELPIEHTRNCIISCTDDMRFLCKVWHGAYPVFDGSYIAPEFAFDRIVDFEDSDFDKYHRNHIELCFKGCEDWRQRLTIIRDDYGADIKNKTTYDMPVEVKNEGPISTPSAIVQKQMITLDDFF